MSTESGIEELKRLREEASLGGGAKRIEAQHAKGKLTARERLALLLDEGTFQEVDPFITHRTTDFGMAEQKYLGDSVVAGYGKIDGRRVCVYAQDFTVFGGSFSEAQAMKVCKVMDLALQGGLPVIGLNDSVGARIQEGVRSLAGYAELFSYLPSNNVEGPPYVESTDDPWRMDGALDSIVPADPTLPYDMKEVIERIFDRGSFFEVHEHFAQNIIVGFARLHGYVVGIVAQQPMVLAGVLDINASDKIARFVRFCDCFNIPLITFIDSPGFLPGTAQEHGGIIRHGAKIVYAYSEATVPKISIVTRKAYGGAYIVMSSKYIRTDLCYAWPSAEIAVLGAEGAVNIIFRREIAAADDPEAERQRLVEEYRIKFARPYAAAASGHIDDVIAPRETRPRLIAALELLKDKQASLPPKKHGNMPV